MQPFRIQLIPIAFEDPRDRPEPALDILHGVVSVGMIVIPNPGEEDRVTPGILEVFALSEMIIDQNTLGASHEVLVRADHVITEPLSTPLVEPRNLSRRARWVPGRRGGDVCPSDRSAELPKLIGPWVRL